MLKCRIFCESFVSTTSSRRYRLHNFLKSNRFFRVLDKVNMTTAEMEEWRQLNVPRTEVEIATVLACGQSFRWKANNADASEWIGVFNHKLWILKQNDTHISYKVLGSSKTENVDKESTENYNKILSQYFQFDVALPSLYKEWAEKDKKFASLTLKDYQGIRMLAQDPIENIFSFICSSNNNIQRISQMVEKLSINYGDKIMDYNGKSYFDFPQVEKLIGEKVEKKLREESFGYRAGFIAKTAEKIVENGGVKWVENLKTLGYDEARIQLQTLPGIGRKVADCICLMSLGYPQAIPVDTHIHQVAKEYLPHLAKVKTLTEKVYSEITDYFRSIYGDYCGWAHSVLFASTLKHLKSTENGKEKKTTKSAKKTEKTKIAQKTSSDKLLANEAENNCNGSQEKVVVVKPFNKRTLKGDILPETVGNNRRSKRLAK